MSRFLDRHRCFGEELSRGRKCTRVRAGDTRGWRGRVRRTHVTRTRASFNCNVALSQTSRTARTLARAPVALRCCPVESPARSRVLPWRLDIDREQTQRGLRHPQRATHGHRSVKHRSGSAPSRALPSVMLSLSAGRNFARGPSGARCSQRERLRINVDGAPHRRPRTLRVAVHRDLSGRVAPRATGASCNALDASAHGRTRGAARDVPVRFRPVATREEPPR